MGINAWFWSLLSQVNILHIFRNHKGLLVAHDNYRLSSLPAGLAVDRNSFFIKALILQKVFCYEYGTSVLASGKNQGPLIPVFMFQIVNVQASVLIWSACILLSPFTLFFPTNSFLSAPIHRYFDGKLSLIHIFFIGVFRLSKPPYYLVTFLDHFLTSPAYIFGPWFKRVPTMSSNHLLPHLHATFLI